MKKKTIEIEVTGCYDDVKEDITQEVLSGEVIGYNAFLSADKVYSVDDLMGVVRKFIAENDEYESASYVVRVLRRRERAGSRNAGQAKRV